MTAIILISIGLFIILAILLYAKLRSYRKGLDRIVSNSRISRSCDARLVAETPYFPLNIS